NQQIIGNVALGEADLLRLGPIHIDMQIGLIERLLNVQIDSPGNLPDPLQQLVGECPVGIHAVARNLNVNGSGQTEVQNLTDNVGRQEREGYAGELLRKFQTQIVNISRRGPVT